MVRGYVGEMFNAHLLSAGMIDHSNTIGDHSQCRLLSRLFAHTTLAFPLFPLSSPPSLVQI
jgi:hypothetical protein